MHARIAGSAVSIASTCIAALLLAAARAEEAPLGLGMEGYAYPHPVRYLDLRMEQVPVRLAYMDVAPRAAANGRAVVLLHGRNFFGAYWENTIDVLTGQGFRVVVPDQVGFGKSSKPDVPHSLHVHALNLRALLVALELDRVTLVGHSLGGMMAARFTLMFPERVDRLVLEGPIGLEDYRVKVPYATRDELTNEALGQSRNDIDGLFRGFFAQWRAEYGIYADAQYRWLLGPERYRIARTAAATYLMAYEQPIVYELPRIEHPTLLIVGEQDRAAIGRNRVSPEARATLGRFPELARQAVGSMPAATLVLLRGVAHIPHLEAPERFHEALLAFLT